MFFAPAALLALTSEGEKRVGANTYLKFEDPIIHGASTSPGHPGEIEVLSWSHGFAQPTEPGRSSPGPGTVEQATHQTFTFTKYPDSSTYDLQQFNWSGKQIGRATLHCYRSDGEGGGVPVEYLTVAMEHVIISNYAVSGGPGDLPVENISLDYGTVRYDYKEQKQ